MSFSDYPVYPASTSLNASYYGSFFSNTPNDDYRKDNIKVDYVTSLPLNVIEYNGGDQGDRYSIDNLTSPSNSVYCARKNHCTVVLSIGDDSSFSSSLSSLIKQINIVAPPQTNYTSPVQNVAIFTSMVYSPDLISKSNEYLENSSVAHLFKTSKGSNSSSPSSSGCVSALFTIPGTPMASMSLNQSMILVHLQRYIQQRQEQYQQEQNSDRIEEISSSERISAESKMEDRVKKNIALFKKELEPPQRPSSRTFQNGKQSSSSSLSELLSHSPSINVKYQLFEPVYKWDPITFAQTLDLSEEKMQLKQSQKSHQDNNCRCISNQRYQEANVKNLFSCIKHEETKIDKEILNILNKSCNSSLEDSSDNKDDNATLIRNRNLLAAFLEMKKSQQTDTRPNKTMHNSPYSDSDMKLPEESSDEEFDEIEDSTSNQDNNSDRYDRNITITDEEDFIDSYTIKTKIPDTKWNLGSGYGSTNITRPQNKSFNLSSSSSSSLSATNTSEVIGTNKQDETDPTETLYPLALATIPNSCEYRNLNITLQKPVWAKYLIVKFSNVSTRGENTNVDVESLSIFGVKESHRPCYEMR